MKAVRIALCVAVALTITPTIASCADKMVALQGAAKQSYGRYVQAYDRFRPYAGIDILWGDGVLAWYNYEPYESWFYGFIYGMDLWRSGPPTDLDKAAMRLWIYKYCSDNPTALFAQSAFQFYRSLAAPLRKRPLRDHCDLF